MTKKYSLYVNRLYTKRIAGWKREESGIATTLRQEYSTSLY